MDECRNPSQRCLRALLNRVRTDENNYTVRKVTLLDIAECVLTRYDFSPEEYREAIAVLVIRLLSFLLYQLSAFTMMPLVHKNRQMIICNRCARCGLPISSKKSLESGLGYVCRKKVNTRWLLHVETRKEAGRNG